MPGERSQVPRKPRLAPASTGSVECATPTVLIHPVIRYSVCGCTATVCDHHASLGCGEEMLTLRCPLRATELDQENVVVGWKAPDVHACGAAADASRGSSNRPLTRLVELSEAYAVGPGMPTPTATANAAMTTTGKRRNASGRRSSERPPDGHSTDRRSSETPGRRSGNNRRNMSPPLFPGLAMATKQYTPAIADKPAGLALIRY